MLKLLMHLVRECTHARMHNHTCRRDGSGPALTAAADAHRQFGGLIQETLIDAPFTYIIYACATKRLTSQGLSNKTLLLAMVHSPGMKQSALEKGAPVRLLEALMRIGTTA